MTNLLHIAASPRTERSASREVAHHFISSYTDTNPETAVHTIDIWQTALPEFDEHAMAAKYAGLTDTPLNASQQTAWDGLRALASHLHQADIVVLSVPLWNFGIPYKLKQLIDLVTQKDILFTFDHNGFNGMLTNKQAVVIYARGLDYGTHSATPSSRFDLQKPYMEMWLKFIGITDTHSIIVEKTLFGTEIDHDARHAAAMQAAQLGRQLQM